MFHRAPVVLLLAAPATCLVPAAVNRRDSLSLIFGSAVAAATGDVAAAASPADAAASDPRRVPPPPPPPPPRAWTVTLPLEPCGGGAVCARFTATGAADGGPSPRKKPRSLLPSAPAVPFRVYRAAVDTGSPYLVVSDAAAGRDVINSGSLPMLLDTNRPMGWGGAFLSLIEESLGVYAPDAALPFGEPPEPEVPFEFSESAYGPTEEIYGSRAGQIAWKAAPIQFRDPRLVPASDSSTEAAAGAANNRRPDRRSGEVVLGVLDEALTEESGGSLLGLVKRSNPATQKVNLRPTFLEQMRFIFPGDPSDADGPRAPSSPQELEVASFAVDCPRQELTLSGGPLIPREKAASALPLVDLRPLGDFVEHYACTVDRVLFDGLSVNSQSLSRKGGKGNSKKPRDIVAVFDTGLTGCLLTQPFWDELVRQGVNPGDFASVKVRIRTVGGGATAAGRKGKTEGGRDEDGGAFEFASSASTNRLFYVNPISLDWFDDDETAPHVIVLGQTFLSQGVLTVDMDERRALFTTES